MHWIQPGQRAPEAERRQGWGMIFGLSSDGRLYIYFDWPLAWQLHNGVRWWLRGLPFFLARADNNCYLGAPHRNIFKHIRSRYFGVPDGH